MEKTITNEVVNLLSVSNNFLILVGLIVLALLIITVLICTGFLKFKDNKLSIGRAKQESKEDLRDIIRKQINYSRNKIQEVSTDYLVYQEDPEVIWKIKYVTEKVFDNVIQWISLNHMNKGDEYYIEGKQAEVLNIIRNIVKSDEVHKEEFQNHMKDEVRNLIENLIDIRDEKEKTEKTILLEKLESIKQEIKKKK
jgi:hypothetical protein